MGTYDDQKQASTVALDSTVTSAPGPANALPAKQALHSIGTSLLPAAVREEVIRRLGLRVGKASANYAIAVAEVKFAKLVQKDDDLPWVVGLLLDAVGVHFASKIASALTTLKRSEASLLEEVQSASNGEQSWRSQAYASLLKTSDASFVTYVKVASSNAQKGLTANAKAIDGHVATEKKADAASFLDKLRNSSDVAFEDLQNRIPLASDVELIALHDAFSVTNHSVDQYVVALKAKLARYEASGVQQIRRSTGGAPFQEPDDAPGNGRDFHDSGGFVIWRSYLSGSPKQLIYQMFGHAKPNNPATDNADNPRHGGKDGVSVPKGALDFFPEQVVVVPDEFREVAIARHTQVWHSAPGVELYDDSGYVWDPARSEAAKKNKASQQGTQPPQAAKPSVPPVQDQTAATSGPSSGAPIAIPDALKLASASGTSQGAP